MPSDKKPWTVYGVGEDRRLFVKLYAVKNKMHLGDALEKIIDEFIKTHEDKNVEK